jgi:abortive infection bacteriophage resistance protein
MSHKQSFAKPALTISQQLDLLSRRNLQIDDPIAAEHILSMIGYYRFISYLKPFLQDPQQSDKGFRAGTQFMDVVHLYSFDRKLRLLVSDAIERIEIAFRTAISDHMSIQHGAHWYLESVLFTNQKQHQFLLGEVNQHLQRSKEDFIRQYYANYDSPAHPPSWMIMECLSFGTISKLYGNLKQRRIRKQIGDQLGQYSEVLKSWMKALTYTRNLCAHHARMWNRFFVIKPGHIPRTVHSVVNDSSFKLQVYILLQLLNHIVPGNQWQQRLIALLSEYEEVIQFDKMGFSLDWREDGVWDR